MFAISLILMEAYLAQARTLTLSLLGLGNRLYIWGAKIHPMHYLFGVVSCCYESDCFCALGRPSHRDDLFCISSR